MVELNTIKLFDLCNREKEAIKLHFQFFLK